MEIIDAAVAVILRDDGKVLLGQRPQGKSWAGWWEFPGGKIESGETPYHALQREMHEELGIEAEQAWPWLTRIFSYPERTVRLHFFTVRSWHGTPYGKELQALSWEDPREVNVGPLLPANAPVLEALRLPPIYAITNLAEVGETAFLEALERALANGLRMIQVREKQLSAVELARFAELVVQRARPHGASVMINGDVELARALGATGVHLPSAMLMAATRKPEGMLCGASCHNAAELAQAALLALDYVLLAPVQPTLTHPDAATLGWAGFAELSQGRPMPIYALGGMTAADLPTAWQHGAHGIAMQRGAWA